MHDASNLLDATTVTRVMCEDSVSRSAANDKLAISLRNIRSGGVTVISIIHQHSDVPILEPMNIHEVFLHVLNIIVTTGKLPGLPNVIDSDHDSTLCSIIIFVDEFEWFIDINHTG